MSVSELGRGVTVAGGVRNGTSGLVSHKITKIN